MTPAGSAIIRLSLNVLEEEEHDNKLLPLLLSSAPRQQSSWSPPDLLQESHFHLNPPAAGAPVPWCPRWRTPGNPLVFAADSGGLKEVMETCFLNHLLLCCVSVLLLLLPGPLWAGTPGYNRTAPVTDGLDRSAGTDGLSGAESGATSTSSSSESLSPSQRDLLLSRTAETRTAAARSHGKRKRALLEDRNKPCKLIKIKI